MTVETVQQNMYVVVCMRSTGEASMTWALKQNGGEDLNEFVSVSKEVVKHLIKSQVREG
jgi:hypothetical protein